MCTPHTPAPADAYRGRVMSDVQPSDSRPYPPTYLSSDHDPLYRFYLWKANLRILDVQEIKTVLYHSSSFNNITTVIERMPGWKDVHQNPARAAHRESLRVSMAVALSGAVSKAESRVTGAHVSGAGPTCGVLSAPTLWCAPPALEFARDRTPLSVRMACSSPNSLNVRSKAVNAKVSCVAESASHVSR